MKPQVIKLSEKSYPADKVWTASAAAYRLNGNRYLKITTGNLKPNRAFMKTLVENPSKILPEDNAIGSKVRDHYKGILVRVLNGMTFKNTYKSMYDESSYLKTAFSATSVNEIRINDQNWNIIASLTSSYFLEVAASEWRKQCDELTENSSPVGRVGEKLSGTFTIEHCAKSKQYRNYAINATQIDVNGNKNLFFWWQDSPARTPGTELFLTGIVKQHYQDKTTQLFKVQIHNELKEK